MAVVYFDSSALVKLMVDEVGSDVAATLWNACDAAFSSRLAYPEVRAVLAAAGRNHDLAESDALAAADDWEQFWSSMRPVELTPDVERNAGSLAVTHHLGGADAVHLASALALGTVDLTVAAWDRRLRAGATSVGFAVAPATLE
ncbi:MAG: type II toxin-antitoxin system VapC family toxin [Actinomycetota bacterium]